VLVFFGDIFIYSKSWEDHIKHVDQVLQILENNQLYVTRYKIYFGKQELEYLVHIVSREGVKVDPQNIQVITKWPIPNNIKNLRGFLGLTGYYRKFINNYARIAKPLTSLLKIKSFVWNEDDTLSFLLPLHA
jgi:hypothetical protein